MNKVLLTVFVFFGASFTLCQTTPPRSSNLVKRTIEWWENDSFLDTLGITEEERDILKPRMIRFQYETQALKTKLKISRKKLNKNLFELSGDTQRMEVEQELLNLYHEMEKHKFVIRHWVSTFFGAARLEILKQDYPLFFIQKWFKNSRTPVIIGSVGPKDDPKQ